MNRSVTSWALYALTLVLLLASLVPAAAQNLEWRHVQGGKYGGAVFTDATHGWLSGDAHLRFTTDGGDVWDEATIDDAAQYEEVRVDLRGMFLVQDPNTDAVTIWVVGDGGVVLQTTNPEGTEWGYLNNPQGVPAGNRMFDATGAPARLYDIFMFADTSYQQGISVGEDGAVFMTTNGGVNWTSIAADVDPVNFASSGDPHDSYVVHFFEDDLNYGIIASEYGTIYTTTDRGLSWARSTSFSMAPSTPAPKPPGTTRRSSGGAWPSTTRATRRPARISPAGSGTSGDTSTAPKASGPTTGSSSATTSSSWDTLRRSVRPRRSTTCWSSTRPPPHRGR